MTVDTEIEAMATISRALGGLEADAVKRVLRWAAERYGAVGAIVVAGGDAIEKSLPTAHSVNVGVPATLPDLYHAASPQTAPERALVAAYWIQVAGGQDDWASQAVNSALKELGHGVGNITDALESLKNQSPGLVMQTRKQGTSRQARKLYRLTVAGIRAVEDMARRGLP